MQSLRPDSTWRGGRNVNPALLDRPQKPCYAKKHEKFKQMPQPHEFAAWCEKRMMIKMPKQGSQLSASTKWKKVALRLLLIAAVAAVAALTGNCPILRMFGVPCPGCGMTRACAALLRLDFRAAAAYHPLVFVLIPGLLYFIFRELLPFSLSRKMEITILAAFFLALVTVYCYRMFLFTAGVLEIGCSNAFAAVL